MLGLSGLDRRDARGDGRLVVPGAEDGGAGDEGVGPGARYLGDVIRFHAAIDFEHDLAPREVYAAADFGQFDERMRDELLPAETGIDRHDQHQVEPVEHMIEIVERRSRIEYQAGLAAVLVDQPDGAIDVLARLRMEADDVGAGPG